MGEDLERGRESGAQAGAPPLAGQMPRELTAGAICPGLRPAIVGGVCASSEADALGEVGGGVDGAGARRAITTGPEPRVRLSTARGPRRSGAEHKPVCGVAYRVDDGTADRDVVGCVTHDRPVRLDGKLPVTTMSGPVCRTGSQRAEVAGSGQASTRRRVGVPEELATVCRPPTMRADSILPPRAAVRPTWFGGSEAVEGRHRRMVTMQYTSVCLACHREARSRRTPAAYSRSSGWAICG